ncbi:MAG: 50S ribosomal protein L21 [Candidatus Gracilibacteria bacterium]|nr:50S ribosomal protein L21 [Candidatus Gracilibacteria bacterium]
MFAVILTGAKQYLVKEGDKIKVEKLETEEGKNHTFDKVLLYSADDKAVEVGTPFLGKKVEAKVLTQGKAKKIVVFKMKAKKNYKRTRGHRQMYTELQITKIS